MCTCTHDLTETHFSTHIAPVRVPSQDRTSQLGPLRMALWDARAKWDDIGIDLRIPKGTLEVYTMHSVFSA